MRSLEEKLSLLGALCILSGKCSRSIFRPAEVGVLLENDDSRGDSRHHHQQPTIFHAFPSIFIYPKTSHDGVQSESKPISKWKLHSSVGQVMIVLDRVATGELE